MFDPIIASLEGQGLKHQLLTQALITGRNRGLRGLVLRRAHDGLVTVLIELAFISPDHPRLEEVLEVLHGASDFGARCAWDPRLGLVTVRHDLLDQGPELIEATVGGALVHAARVADDLWPSLEAALRPVSPC